MHYLLAWPLYFWGGLVGLYHLSLLIPHPSWHRLIEAFMTGLIIKSGYITAHKLSAVYKLETKRKKPTAATGSGLAAAVSEFVEQ